MGALNRHSLGIRVDGGDFTEGLFGDLGGSRPLMAIQEFTVIQSRYSADLGRAASGLVDIVTRRGGNKILAEGFTLYRNRALNALGAFEREKPDFHRWHWGVAAGGPVAVDRTHIFAAFERRAQNDFATVYAGGAFPELEGTYRTPFEDNLMFARLDHRVSDTRELTLRFAGEVGERLIGVGGGDRGSPGNGQNNTLDMHSVLVVHRWAPDGSWLNETRLHFMDQRRNLLRVSPPGPTLVYPSLVVGPSPSEERSRSRRLELRNDLSKIVGGPAGSHRLQVGTHLSWLDNETRSSFFEHGLFRFLDDADTVPFYGQVSFRDPAVRLDATNLQLAFYAQDNWNPISDLTLQIGLRYDLETNGSNQDFVSPFAGRLPFVPTTSRPIDKDNLAPRIGIAWDPVGDGRTVVRAGFGIFYDALVAGPLLALERSSGVPLAQFWSPGTADVDELMINPDTVPPIIWTAGRIETPMTRQFSVGVEGILPGEFVVRIDGMVILGRNLLLQRNLNPFVDVETLERTVRRFPEYSRATEFRSDGRAEARMLMINVRRTFGRGWVDMGYTLAQRKNTNDTWGRPLVPQTKVGRLDLDEEWGWASWDERHRIVATVMSELAAGFDLAIKTVYASARPFTAVQRGDPNGDGDFDNDRPPGEPRNARRGPDFLRTDLSLTWSVALGGSTRPTLVANVYNIFNRVNGIPESVIREIGSPLFGQATAAFPPRQVEVGFRLSVG